MSERVATGAPPPAFTHTSAFIHLLNKLQMEEGNFHTAPHSFAPSSQATGVPRTLTPLSSLACLQRCVVVYRASSRGYHLSPHLEGVTGAFRGRGLIPCYGRLPPSGRVPHVFPSFLHHLLQLPGDFCPPRGRRRDYRS